MTCLVRARCAHPIKTSARWRNFSQRCITMIIEAYKLQFGSIINLLLRFILHVSALQLMRWLQSYDRLKFCATVRVRSEVRWQNSGAGFDGIRWQNSRLCDFYLFTFQMRAQNFYLFTFQTRPKLFSIIYPP